MANALIPRNRISKDMRRDNRANRTSQHKRIPLCKLGTLDGLEYQQRRPDRRRLGHCINHHEGHGPLHGRVPQLAINPSVQNARHRHG